MAGAHWRRSINDNHSLETPMLNKHQVFIAASMAAAVLSTTNLSAQATDSSTNAQAKRWELTVPGGTLVQTGAQRDVLKRGDVTAIQLTYAPRQMLAFTSTAGWARSRDLATEGDPKLDVFTYDVGAELRAPRIRRKSLTFMPFAGAGAGGRTYDYRSLDVDATHNVAAYASIGGDVLIRRIGIRLEARDYVAGFKPLTGGGVSRTSNDVAVMIGVRLVSR
jgi:hypothetical protein